MNMGGERQGDWRVPLLSGLFFISCLVGGIILTLWLLDSKGSQPWFPILALVLIGFPWIFWALICCYAINKRCLTGGEGNDGQPRTVSNRMKPVAANNADLGSRKNGPVVVVDNCDLSVGSDKESEMPLNQTTAS